MYMYDNGTMSKTAPKKNPHGEYDPTALLSKGKSVVVILSREDLREK
jgi:hypothetical protein